MKGQVNCIKIKEKNNHNILNSTEIQKGGSNIDSGSKRGVQCYGYVNNIKDFTLT